MGQKISTTPVDKSVQDASRWKLYMFVLKLIDPSEYEYYANDLDVHQNYN